MRATAEAGTAPGQHVDALEIARRGLLGLIMALTAVALLRVAAVATLGGAVAGFQPLGWSAPLTFTALAAVAATAAYALLRRVTAAPDRAFTLLAAAALLLSFIPDLQLLMDPTGAAALYGVTRAPPAGVATLMLMHVAAAVAITGALTGRIGGARPDQRPP